MELPARITGTFIDEITHDIPSQNWSAKQWSDEFALYQGIGIDTVIIIRAGYRDRCIFPSRSVPNQLPAYDDLAALFLDLAERHGITLFFGLYDSGVHWLRGAWWEELEVNKRFIEEVASRYGSSKAFGGWYICHETSRNNLNIIELFNGLGKACKAAIDRPILISPYPQGAKQFSGSDVFSTAESMTHWERIFAETGGAFDICAFQDGQVQYGELAGFASALGELGKRHGVTIWMNAESFDRDMPIKFPPANWSNLRYKLEAAAPHVEKLITFEFAHFMSPSSCYPAAHNLFRRYAEYADITFADRG